MTELADDVHEEIALLAERGDHFAESGQYKAAISNYRKALKLVPEPTTDWEAGTWLYAAIADAHFLSADFEACLENIALAAASPDGEGNPFIHLRWGQAALEVGDESLALEQLRRAFAVAGPDLFAEDDQKYIEWLMERMQA